jgi:Spy/CpxP family protein refolding chaperone
MRKLSVVFLFVLVASVVYAQPPGGPPLERIERFKKMRMLEMLELNEEQSVRFIARYNEHENKRRDLMRQRDEVLDKIERLLRIKADAKEYEKLFTEVVEINRRMGEDRLNFFNSLSDLLTIEQRAKLLLFERRFENELREAMREARERRRGGM